MNKRTLSVNDVRKVCETLVSNKGDVYETSLHCGYTMELVKRIKYKKIYKAISDSYFQLSDWGETEPGVREPDEVKLTIDNLETTPTPEPEPEPTPEPDPEPKKPKWKMKREEKIHAICVEIAKGVSGVEIAHKLNTSASTVSKIRMKRRYKEISDEYFTVRPNGDVVTKDGTVIKNAMSHPAVSETDNRKNKIAQVKNKTNTIQINITSSNNIIDEIYDLASQALMKKPIEQLPDRIQEKILSILKEEVDNMSIKEIKEMIIDE